MPFDNLVEVERFDKATALTFSNGETETRVWVPRRVEVSEGLGGSALTGAHPELFDQPEQLVLFENQTMA